MCSHISVKEWTQIRKAMLQKVELQKTGAQYSYSLPQIPKEIYFSNRRDWWLENSRAQKRISEQSPVRCRGIRSHNSVDTTRVKPELHRRRRRIYESFQSRHRSQKVFYTNDFSEFGKYWEESSWNHRTASHSREQRQGVAERAVRRVEEGTSAVLLESGLNEKWWSDSMKNAITICKMSKTSWQTGNLKYERRSVESFKGPVRLFGALVGYFPKLREK